MANSSSSGGAVLGSKEGNRPYVEHLPCIKQTLIPSFLVHPWEGAVCISWPCCGWKADSVLRHLMGQPGVSGLQKMSEVGRGISSLVDPSLAGGSCSEPSRANQGARVHTCTCSTRPMQHGVNRVIVSRSAALAASSLSEGFFKPLAVRKPRKMKSFHPPWRRRLCERCVLGAGQTGQPLASTVGDARGPALAGCCAVRLPHFADRTRYPCVGWHSLPASSLS